MSADGGGDEVWRRLRADAARSVRACDEMLRKARTARQAAFDQLDPVRVASIDRIIDELLDTRQQLRTSEGATRR